MITTLGKRTAASACLTTRAAGERPCFSISSAVRLRARSFVSFDDTHGRDTDFPRRLVAIDVPRPLILKRLDAVDFGAQRQTAVSRLVAEVSRTHASRAAGKFIWKASSGDRHVQTYVRECVSATFVRMVVEDRLRVRFILTAGSDLKSRWLLPRNRSNDFSFWNDWQGNDTTSDEMLQGASVKVREEGT